MWHSLEWILKAKFCTYSTFKVESLTVQAYSTWVSCIASIMHEDWKIDKSFDTELQWVFFQVSMKGPIEGLVQVNSSCWLALVSIWVSPQYGVLNLEASICGCFLEKNNTFQGSVLWENICMTHTQIWTWVEQRCYSIQLHIALITSICLVCRILATNLDSPCRPFHCILR